MSDAICVRDITIDQNFADFFLYLSKILENGFKNFYLEIQKYFANFVVNFEFQNV